MTSAVARLHALIRLETEMLGNNGLGRTYGYDWFELSEDEARVFDLSLDDLPALVSVWMAFEAVMDICDMFERADQALLEEVRGELSWLRLSIEAHALECHVFQRFAKLFGISHRLAHAWFAKRHFYDIRSGIAIYGDEGEMP